MGLCIPYSNETATRPNDCPDSCGTHKDYTDAFPNTWHHTNPGSRKRATHPFTYAEVRRAAKRIKSGKAGGPDGIPPEGIKTAVSHCTREITGILNDCLKHDTFPSCWKTGKLVLIPKPGKDPKLPNAYRPLTLLNSGGKLLEQLLKTRLQAELDDKMTISDRQFGFRSGKSTLDACAQVKAHLMDWKDSFPAILLIDAFNSAR